MEVMSTPEPEVILEEHLLDISLRPTPTTLIAHEQFSSYINDRLVSTINKTIELSPTVARVIEKRDKGAKIMLLNSVLIGEELQQRKEAEVAKIRRKQGNRQVQQYGTIRVGDARLKLMARDEAIDRRIELYNQRQEEKEQERREIADRKEVRLQKRQEKKRAKDKRIADKVAKAAAKELEIERKRAIKEAKAATKLANN
jgi:hypothetical protein